MARTITHTGGLVKGQPVYPQVDSFSENGITEGKPVNL
jgi:hypothetical protein